jgi:hypothetical protein
MNCKEKSINFAHWKVDTREVKYGMIHNITFQ